MAGSLSPSQENGEPSSSQSTSRKLATGILLIIFIHGFKGDDTTFGSFPSRLQHILSETLQGVAIECIVFPAYETKGDLDKAVERFADWLTTLTVEKEVAHGAGGGAGHAKIILCGHSMGGLLAADSTYAFINTRPDTDAPLWPNIVACLAFDTPYLGLHPHVFKNSATKAAGYVQNVHKAASGVWGTLNSSGAKPAGPVVPPAGLLPASAAPPTPSPGGWSRWAPAAYAVGGALLAGAAAGTAYYRRADIGSGYGALMEHMQYVGALWDENALTERVRHLVEGEKTHGVVFRIFYTLLPPISSSYPSQRTFCVLPKGSSDASQHFVPAHNTLAEDEVRAHVGMFEPGKNDGYYQLGLEAAAVIRQAMGKDSVVEQNEARESTPERGVHGHEEGVRQTDEGADDEGE
ncbi:hypothetical protein BC834DRAFT_688066 [Gloeopeniophorella convolvens]|nr:hypothetical protein BC834DRAFT_688066 [Gloeopeniophorella convolvens]